MRADEDDGSRGLLGETEECQEELCYDNLSPGRNSNSDFLYKYVPYRAKMTRISVACASGCRVTRGHAHLHAVTPNAFASQ